MNKAKRSPLHLFVASTLAIFIGEVAVMFLLAELSPIPYVLEAILDGVLLTLIATPVLYFYLFRPMVRAEHALEEANGGLERRVAERTAELTSANASLAKNNDFITRVVESAPCLFMIYDLGTQRCNYVNGHLEEMLGYSADEASLSQDLLRQLLTPHDFNALLEVGDLEGADYPDYIDGQDARLLCKDGASLLCNVNVNVMSRNPDGSPREILLAALPAVLPSARGAVPSDS